MNFDEELQMLVAKIDEHLYDETDSKEEEFANLRLCQYYLGELHQLFTFHHGN